MEGMNTILYFWRKEKNQEVLICFCVFWERNMERKKMHKKMLPKRLPFNLSCQEPFIGLDMLFGARCTYKSAGGPCWCVRSGPADVNNLVLMHFFSFDFKRAFGGLPGLRLRRSWFPWKDLDV